MSLVSQQEEEENTHIGEEKAFTSLTATVDFRTVYARHEGKIYLRENRSEEKSSFYTISWAIEYIYVIQIPFIIIGKPVFLLLDWTRSYRMTRCWTLYTYTHSEQKGECNVRLTDMTRSNRSKLSIFFLFSFSSVEWMAIVIGIDDTQHKKKKKRIIFYMCIIYIVYYILYDLFHGLLETISRSLSINDSERLSRQRGRRFILLFI
jgi:hypothetical protein